MCARVFMFHTHIYHIISKNNFNIIHYFIFNSYRIEHIFDEKILEMSKKIKQYVLYKRLIHAIYFHRRAVELVLIYYTFFCARNLFIFFCNHNQSR